MQRKYWFQVAVAFDQLLNAIAKGWADETLSARAYRNRHRTWWRFFMKVVDGGFRVFGQREHCKQAHKFEQMRFTLPPDFRKDGP